MSTTTHTIFWIQGEFQQGWRRLQQCSDSEDALQALERLQTQGRYDNLRLLQIDQNDWNEPVKSTALRIYQSGQRLSDADTDEQTRTLQIVERRQRVWRALPRLGALALTLIASVSLGVWVATF
ncbi:MAG: hypothetical protein JKY20_05940 [Alphaproteobacteria bacterium]|nr:hypothetical protein [Alphaproteobacteria bacterium]